METRTYNVYKFDELDENSQNLAIEKYRYRLDYPWHTENVDSLNAFCNLLNIKVKNFEYGYHSYINFYIDGMTDNAEVFAFTGIRLLKWIENNIMPYLLKGKYYSNGKKHRYSKINKEYSDCPLTGYCIDCSLIQPLLDFRKTVSKDSYTTLSDIIGDCLNNWIKDCNADFEYYYSDENIKDMLFINDYDFTIQGEIDE